VRRCEPRVSFGLLCEKQCRPDGWNRPKLSEHCVFWFSPPRILFKFHSQRIQILLAIPERGLLCFLHLGPVTDEPSSRISSSTSMCPLITFPFVIRISRFYLLHSELLRDLGMRTTAEKPSAARCANVLLQFRIAITCGLAAAMQRWVRPRVVFPTSPFRCGSESPTMPDLCVGSAAD
jgi:hypothetical protein